MNGRTHPIRRANIKGLMFKRLFKLLLNRPDFTAAAPRDPSEKRGRSVNLRVVDCGSCNAAEQEIQSMFNPVYDAGRFGFHLVASPRQADVLLVTGPLTRNMEAALLAAFRAMPEPRRVVTLGDEMSGQGIFASSYAFIPLPEEIQAACVAHIPGDPPAPDEIIEALRKIDFR